MKRKTLLVLSVLALLCSSFSVLIAPAKPVHAIADGWVNRQTINYGGVLFQDLNSYDINYTYASPKAAPVAGCAPDKITFTYTVNIRGGTTPPLENIKFFYGPTFYAASKQNYVTQVKSGPTGVCQDQVTPIATPIANPNNRRIVFVKSTNGATIRNIINGVVFEKLPAPFGPGNAAMYVERAVPSDCKDMIIEHEADPLEDGVSFAFAASGPEPGSATLYAVQASADNANKSESYASDVLGGVTLNCYNAFNDDTYKELTEAGGYGLTASKDPAPTTNDNYGWGSGRFVANGLNKAGGWYRNDGDKKDDAFVVFIGNETDNLQAGGVVPPIPGQGQGAAGNTVCDKVNGGGLGWLFCAISQALIDTLSAVDKFILDRMQIDTESIFNTGAGQPGESFRKAWGIFRNLAYALLVIVGLIMVVSQIMGLDFFDAYTIRKMLPKLVAAAVFIPLMWPILKILFEMSNDAATAVEALIYSPFEGTGKTPSDFNIAALITGGGVLGAAGILAGTSFLVIGGWGVFLALLGSAFLALITAFFILVARDVVAYGLIMASSVAIVCATFEPLQKVFGIWRTYLVTIMLAVPAVSGILAVSKVAAKIGYTANNGDVIGILLAIAFIIIGYASFWKVFKQIDKASGQIAHTAENVSGKAQKALAGYRSEARKKRLGEAVEGKREFGRGPLGWLGNRGAGVVRRAKLSGEVGAGAFGFGKTGRAQYNEAVKTMQARTAAGMIDHDKDRAGGDDDAMRLLGRRGMDKKRFIKEYATLQQRSAAASGKTLSRADAEQKARVALGLSQSSLGAEAGTNSMRIAAQKSLLKSNTSYRRQLEQKPDGTWENKEMGFEQMSKTMYGDVSELVQDGLITVADGAAMIKSNGARADRAGVGFGKAMTELDNAATKGTASMDTQGMLDDALIGTGPGQLIGQRHEAVRILAPEMLKRAQAAASRDRTPDGQRQLGREFVEQIAMAAGRADLGANLPELNASLNTNSYIGARIEDNGPTVGQWVEFMRTPSPDSPIYQEMLVGHRNQIAAQNPGADPAAIEARATQETRTQIENAQRVFQEYRREYASGWQQGGRPPGADPTAPVGGIPKIPGVG